MQQHERLGAYEILEKLGEGGMGEVWRARDDRLNRSVAVKILSSDVANDPMRQARFEQEARSLGALNHPNIVAVYATGQDNGTAYIVSELVDGETLRAILDRGPLGSRKAVQFGVQIAEALAAAHAAGIVHRDLKPENIMITRNGRVKVLDFGLARQNPVASSDRTATVALSTPGVVMGTVGYMSPEQVRGEAVDARSDIFSFGAVLYEMVGGRRVFQRESSVETMNAILHDDLAELQSSDATPLPTALDTIIRRCLEKPPAERFQSAADLAFALRQVSTTSSGVQPAIPATRKTHLWLWPAVAALTAIALFAGGFSARMFTAAPAAPTYERLTFHDGTIQTARFTPDGRNFVYTASWDNGPFRTYFGTVGNPESRDLMFPDNSHVLSVSMHQDVAWTGPKNTLMRSSISGGEMRPWLENVIYADWSPDGSSIAIVRKVNGKYRLEYPLGKILLDGYEWPQFSIRVSPDGEHIAFSSYFERSSALALFTVDRAGKVTNLGRVSGQGSTVGSTLCWSPDGREIWYRSFDRNDTGTIYAMDMHGKSRVVTHVPAHVMLYDLARNGAALFSTMAETLGILGMGPGDTAERDLSPLDASGIRGISQDGRIVLANIIGEAGGAKGSIYMRKTDGSPAVRLGDGVAFALSPDGQWVSGYTLTDAGARRYVLLPTGAGEEQEIQVPSVQGIVVGWLGSDKLLVAGSRPGRKWQCFAWDRTRGTMEPICPEGMPDALMVGSPDGKQVLCPGATGGWYLYSAGGGVQKVNGLAEDEHPVDWRADSHSLYVVSNGPDGRQLVVSILDPVTGKRMSWKTIHPSRPVGYVSDLRVTPDGRAYVYGYTVAKSQLYVARGWK
jgi:eukaryotic-like serine/threonine-protein kinase